MTASVSYLLGLEPLTQALSHHLQETGLCPRLTAVDCRTDQKRLWVLVKHAAPQPEQPSVLLEALRAALYEVIPEVGLSNESWADPSEIPIRLGLQLAREANPYVTHTFTWRIADAVEVVFGSAGPESTILTESADAASDLLPEVAPAEAALGSLPSTEQEVPEADANNADEEASELPSSNSALLVLTEAVVPASKAIQRWQQWGEERLQRVIPYWGYGLAGLVLVSSGLLTYTLTRPCVVGRCDRISQARARHENALTWVNVSANSADLQRAQAELQTAADWVAPVPHWSPHYGEAQADLESYQTDLRALGQLLGAKNRAVAAAEKSQKPPHPIQHWSEVEHDWRQAVTLLEQVPSSSRLYLYAQTKLAEYRANRDAITHRVSAETDAEAHLNNAVAAARLAQRRMETAKTPMDWQLVAQRWQSAIQWLSLVPQGTEAYPEAQRYRAEYQQQLGQLRGQANQEGFAISSFEQAQEAARQAGAYAAKKQWTLAVNQWRIAVANLRGVPSGSPLADNAQERLAIYQASLAQAQTQLRTAVALQTLRTNLMAVCQTSAMACRVNTPSNQIQITLASQYAAALREATTPPLNQTVPTLNRDAQTLIQHIIQTGNQVQQPIEIYDAQGSFIARYRPELGGFTKS